MKTLIVYYSLEGNTEYVAQKIAEKTGCDILRLEPKKQYPNKGFKKFFWGGKSSVMAETPELEAYVFDTEKYGRIVFGFPVWAASFAPPIRTFIKDNNLAGKRIAAYACESGSGGEKAFEKLKKVIGTNDFEAEMILIDPKDKPKNENDQKIEAFCRKIENND